MSARAVLRAALMACALAWAVSAQVAQVAQAAQRVAVSGDVEDGGGRLEFVWPRAVVYEARLVLSRLVVRFSEPGDYDFTGFQSAMRQYLGKPTVVAKGAVIAFPLKAPVTLRHNQVGGRITIELIDEAAGAAVTQAAEAAVEPQVEPAEGQEAEVPAVAEAEPAEATPEDLVEAEPEDLSEEDSEAPAEEAAEPLEDEPEDLAVGLAAETNPAPTETPDETPIETQAGTGGGTPLSLRVGDHAGFSRMVFDWPREVAYDIAQRGNKVVIDFAAEAELDLADYRARGLDNVFEISTAAGESGLRVTLRLTGDLLVRHFLNGSFVVVDVVHDPSTGQLGTVVPATGRTSLAETATASETQEIPADAPDPVLALATPNLSGLEDQAQEYASDNDEDSEPVPTAVEPVETEVLSDPPPATALGSTLLPGDDEEDAGEVDDLETAADLPDTPDADQRFVVSPGPNAPTSYATRATSEPLPGPTSLTGGLGSAELGELTTASLDEPEDAGDQWESVPETPPSAERPLMLRFEWPSDPGLAAAFRRGQHLWVVFDQTVAEAAGSRIAESVPALAPVERLAADNAPAATVLRFKLPSGLSPAMRREDRAWVVDLRSQSEAPETPLDLEYMTERPDPRLRFAVEGAESVLRVRDPDLGDRIAVVPLPFAGQGLDRPRRFLQFRALASYQGLAIVPLSDGLSVEAGAEGVVVRDEAGLLISPGADRDRKLRDRNDFESGLRLFDLEGWRQADRGSLSEVRQDLLDAVVAAPPEEAAAPRLDLARFYFAHGLATEALDVLRLISQEDERLAGNPQVHLLRAASELLAGNRDRALALLNDPVLAGEREALPWQAASAAIVQDWPSAVGRFALSDPLIANYVPRVRIRLRLLAAEARLGIGDSDGAGRYLEAVRADQPNVDAQAQLDYLLGKQAKLDGDTAEARARWQQVAAGSHRQSRARARLALVELGLETGSLPLRDAIKGLETLRSGWRGESMELVLLQRLAELEVASGDYEAALGSLRDAAKVLPGGSPSDRARMRLSRTFAEVVLNGPGELVAPEGGAALYEAFATLLPTGPAGDRLIADLADRLIDAEWFDEAANLLTDHAARRLAGEAKVRTGARVAWIRLLESKPVQVLTALNASLPEAGFASLPPQLERDRRHLRARALALLGQTAEAVALLDGDDSVEALHLNAEILWAKEDWPAAAGILEKLVPPPSADVALSDADSEALLNLAVAYRLSDRSDDLGRIGADYGSAMADTARHDDFAWLTGDGDGGDGGVSDGGELAEVASFEAFMSGFKDRLTSGPSGETGELD